MYDTEEELKRKRRKLIILIGIVVFLIILLIFFILTKDSLFKKKENISNDISCSLEIMDGVLPNDRGIYNENITIGFKDITSSSGLDIVRKTIGTSDSPKNKETYEIKRSGEYLLYGYVEDSKGNIGKCEIKVVVSTTKPTCELEIIRGTMGENGWYKDNVEVKFKEIDTNNSTLEIDKKYIIKAGETEPTTSIDSYSIVENGTIELEGYVEDSAGAIGTCNITVKKDSTAPSCALVVKSGTKDSTGAYTDNPTIGFSSTSDDVTTVVSSGIGTSKNYEKQSYTITEVGLHVINGYVKDEAGNEGVCSITVQKAKKQESGGGSTPKPKTSDTKCTISLCAPQIKVDGAYPSGIKVLLKTYTTNGATVASYGITTNGSYDYNNIKQLTINNNGTYNIRGIVKDSYGGVAKCQISEKLIISINTSYDQTLKCDF